MSTRLRSLQYRLMDKRPRGCFKVSADAGMDTMCESLVLHCALENETVHGIEGYFGTVEFASREIRSAQLTTDRSMLNLGRLMFAPSG
ncbi:MAG: hypothetical protein ACOH1V_09350 [Stenotrophomonas sp.]